MTKISYCKYSMDEKGLTFVDYTFTLHEDSIVFDHEITLGKLRLQPGQYLKVLEGPQGTVILQKVDSVVAFTDGYPVNYDK